jgi:DNA-binding CsgD family transcriptional regulator
MNPVHANNLSGEPEVMYTTERYDNFVLYHAFNVGPEEETPAPISTVSTIRLVSLLETHGLLSVDPQGLSERNMQTLIWGVLGKTAQEQAQEQGVAERTARTYRTELFQAIGATSVTHATHVAFRDEILYPGNRIPPLELTPRDRDVLRVMSRGITAEDAANELRLGPETVRTHMKNILRKNALGGAAGAITLGYLSGDIPLPKR